MDSWNKRDSKFVGISATTLNSKLEYNKNLLRIQNVDECNSSIIKKIIERTFKEYEVCSLQKKIKYVVSDGGSYILPALESLGIQRLWYINYIINLSIRDGVNAVLWKKMSKIIISIRFSPFATNNIKLKNFTPT